MRNLALFDYSDGKYPRYQVDKVLPYQFEPKLGLQTSDSGDESDSEEQSESSDEEIRNHHVFEVENAWRIAHCALKPKDIELFCCHDKALEYDE